MPSDLLKVDPTQAGPELPATEDARIQPIHPRHAADLAAACLAAYPPEAAAATLHDAIREMEQTFANHYGRLLPECSSAAVPGARAVGAVFVVQRSIGDPGLPGPFIIDLFVAPAERGRGLGRALVLGALSGCARSGHRTLSLRVGEGTSAAAWNLYRQLGFCPIPCTG